MPAIQEGLHAFTGAGRRFERKGEYHGAVLYDDYAHHPGELRALLSTARTLGYERVICAFQPHTYSRTKELFDDFVEVLKLPDKVLLAEIFAARETDTLGISSRDLAARIPGAEYCPTLEEVTRPPGPAGPARGPAPHRGGGGHPPGRRAPAGAALRGRGAPHKAFL